MVFLDTNIFIRFLTSDDPAKGAACRDLLDRVDTGQESATTSESVIAEIFFILTSTRHYHLTAADAASRMAPLLALKGLVLPHKHSFRRALDLVTSYPHLDFEDAMTVAHMERSHLTTLLSYDRGFDQVATVQRVEP